MSHEEMKSFNEKIDKIEAGCNCTSNLLPANQNPEKQLKACTFAKQSVCASKYVKVFLTDAYVHRIQAVPVSMRSIFSVFDIVHFRNSNIEHVLVSPNVTKKSSK